MRPLRLAATLSWVWGITLVLTSIGVFVTLAVRDTLTMRPLVALVLGLASCLAGGVIGQGRRVGGWIAIAVSGTWVALPLLGGGSPWGVSTLVSVVIAGATLAGWRDFR